MAQIEAQTIQIPVADGTRMDGFLARLAGGKKRAGLLVFQEAFGVNHHIRNVCTRYAAEGFVALAPELFHRTAPGFEGHYDDFQAVMPHMKALTDAGLEADVRAAHGVLSALPSVVAERIACVGYCMGGRVSFLADAVLPLRAAISYYGGGIAPHPMNPGLLARAGELHAPILLFWGGLDKHIGPEQTRAVVDALRSAAKTFINVEVSDADHGFNCDERESYNAPAAAQAQTLSLAFLNQHLKR